MKIYNDSSKGKFYSYKVNGVARKIFIRGYETFDVPDILDESQINYNAADQANIDVEVKWKKYRKKKTEIVEDFFEGGFEYLNSNLKRVQGVAIINNEIFAGGICGIVKSKDVANNSWTQIYSAPEIIRNICKIDNGNLIAVGGKGYNSTTQSYLSDSNIIISHNSGNTWTEVIQTASTTMLNSFSNVGNKLWAAGKEIINSIDGGITWSAQTNPLPTITFNVMQFIDENKGWCSGLSGKIIHTEDGGQTWTAQTIAAGTANLCCKFINSTKGFAAASDGKIFYTSNAGATWAQSTLYPTSNRGFNDIYFFDSNNALALGTSFSVYKTDNGGISWTAKTTPSPAVIFAPYGGIVFKDDSITGYCFCQGGTLKTVNGGETWTEHITKAERILSQLIKSGNELLYCSNSSYGISTNNGLNFTTQNFYPPWSATSFTGQIVIAKLDQLENNDIYYVRSRANIYKSINSGSTWTVKTFSKSMFDFCFINNSTGWICGASGYVYKTTNSGSTWMPQTSSALTTTTLFSIYFKNENEGIAMGASGVCIFTIDGGTTWSANTNCYDNNYTLKNYTAINDNLGYAFANTNNTNNTREHRIIITNNFGKTFDLVNTLDIYIDGTDKIYKITDKIFLITGFSIAYTLDAFKTIKYIQKNTIDVYSNVIQIGNQSFRLLSSNLSDFVDVIFGERFKIR